MSFLHNHSCECVKSELDLFALPSTQTSIENGLWIHYKPISSLADDGPIEFQVPGTGDDYIDLSHTLLHIKAKVLNQDSTNLISATAVAPVNNWLHSLFSQLDVYLNQKLVSPPNNTYAYRAYMETLLNYAPAAKQSHLTCSLWYDDTAGKNGFHRCLYIDGQQIPSKALQPSFNNNIFTSAYHTLFSGTGIHFLNEGNAISREQYAKGYCLLAFDLTPDLSANSSAHWNLIKHGSVRLEVRFEYSLIQTINCIVYAEFDNIIEIDKNRNVTVDYSS
ncbi:hypothetical protein HF086_003503 [Spodoptera exigua]|uniref:Uncharacterized protein n=1 Tax=Spodoptera exigua TaxID=7107 RepID=A0A922SMN6_SPOEX|nr:hypothetical protein HF086_003503 [Spodoptera exigua]